MSGNFPRLLSNPAKKVTLRSEQKLTDKTTATNKLSKHTPMNHPNPDNDGYTKMETQSDNAPAESLWLNLLFNLLVPNGILIALSDDQYLGIKFAIVLAILFPVSYGVRDFMTRGKYNFFSALGIVSVLFTGGVNLLELDASYIAIKEAAIPGLFGLATLLSLKTSKPVIRIIMLNDTLFEVDKVAAALEKNGRTDEFNRLLVNGSWILAGGFLLSSTLNYGLAKALLTAAPGTVAFNEQLGTMQFLSFPVIVLPFMLILFANLFYLMRGMTRLTGLPWEDLLKNNQAS